MITLSTRSLNKYRKVMNTEEAKRHTREMLKRYFDADKDLETYCRENGLTKPNLVCR